MRLNRRVLLASFLILTAGSCATTVAPELPCPARPTLEPLSVELQAEMPPEAILIVGENQLRLKAHIRKLESRLGCNE